MLPSATIPTAFYDAIQINYLAIQNTTPAIPVKTGITMKISRHGKSPRRSARFFGAF
jgi:hypothetical protein